MAGPLRFFAGLALLAGMPGVIVALMVLADKDGSKWAAVIPLGWFLACAFYAVLLAGFAQVLDRLGEIADNTRKAANKPTAVYQQAPAPAYQHPQPQHNPFPQG